MKIDELYNLRMLVFIESEDNTFNQVILTQKQYKAISDIISVKTEDQDEMRPGFEKVEIEIPSDTFIGMNNIS